MLREILKDARRSRIRWNFEHSQAAFRNSTISSTNLQPTTVSCKMKRKSTEAHAANGKGKKRALDEHEVRKSFRDDLFEADTLKRYRDDYVVSKPSVYEIFSVNRALADGVCVDTSTA